MPQAAPAAAHQLQASGTDHSSQPRGFGFAVFRAWQGQAELPPAFLDGDFKPYEPRSTKVFLDRSRSLEFLSSLTHQPEPSKAEPEPSKALRI